MPAKKKPAATKKKPANKIFTAEERAAMKEYVAEKKRSGKVDGEQELLAKIAEMREPDRTTATRLHALVKASAPSLAARTWYGMPAYARDGEVVCFFQSGQKFKTRYATLGFSDKARLDDGSMWPVAFALTTWTPEIEARVAALVKRALG